VQEGILVSKWTSMAMRPTQLHIRRYRGSFSRDKVAETWN